MELTSRQESLIKTITYRAASIILTYIAIQYFTRQSIAMSLTALTQGFGTLFYYLHERLWSKVGRDRKLTEMEKKKTSD